MKRKLAVFSTNRLVTASMTDLLQKRAQDGLTVAQNFFLSVLDELAFKVQILAQSRDIREAVRARDVIELIDKISLANSHLKLNVYDAITEVYDADGALLAGEPCTRYPLCPPALVEEARRGKILSFREIVDGHLRICSAAPLYHESAPAPIGVVVISVFSTHQFAEEIKKIVGADITCPLGPICVQSRGD
jgi:hypothetical protein